jgi:predicted ATPase/DNA-binding winged helix-turn-helix (wHTH) protein
VIEIILIVISSSVSPALHLDSDNERLWLGPREIRLRPKAFAVLRYLIEQHGRLVSRDELAQAVWPHTKVSEVVLRVCLRDVRQAVEDSAQAPQFIETIPRRGWRFIGPPTLVSLPSSANHQFRAPTSRSEPSSSSFLGLLVGREHERGQLQQSLEKARHGERQIVFVSGEAGIGKTALVNDFLAQAAARGEVLIARGQCVEQYGAGEPYLPVLEAMAQLCRTSPEKQMISLLHRRAPMWLLQMPELLEPEARVRLQHSLPGVSQDRMLRGMVAFIDAVMVEHSLILVLEDLHWSDTSTLSLISFLGRHHEAARLMIIGTYRPEDITRRKHSLRAIVQEFTQGGYCGEIPLAGLTESAVTEYITRRFPENALPSTFGKTIYLRTEGSPLFIVNMMTHLVSQGLIVSRNGRWELEGKMHQLSIPETLQHVIDGQLDQLSLEEQRVLEVGSVAGIEFSASLIAAALEDDLITIEECCETLVRHHLFLQGAGTPTGNERRLATRYRFLHSLYHSLIYKRLSQARRRQLHLCIGTLKEREYGERATEVAAELATHFEEGRDYHRTIHYLNSAAKTAMRRHAPQDALIHLQHAKNLLSTLPETPEQMKQAREIHRALQHSSFSVVNMETQFMRSVPPSHANSRKTA